MTPLQKLDAIKEEIEQLRQRDAENILLIKYQSLLLEERAKRIVDLKKQIKQLQRLIKSPQ